MLTRKCPAGILGINLVIRGQASIYFIRFDQAAGAAKLINEVAGRLKWVYGVPWWSYSAAGSKGSIRRRRNGERQSSGGLAKGWIVKGLIMDESPQDVQQLVHEHAEGLHLGERILFSLLQMGIELSEVLILLDHA